MKQRGLAGPRHLVVPDALLVPWGADGNTNPAKSPQAAGGVFDAAGAPVPLAAHQVSRRLFQGLAGPPPPPAARLPGTWLFGGVLRAHFGHFLDESLSRLWAVPALASADLAGIAFLPWEGRLLLQARRVGEAGVPPLPGFVGELLHLLGITAKLRIVGSPSVAERLIVPEQLSLTLLRAEEPGFAVQRGFLAGMAERVPADAAPAAPRIYVSRARLPLSLGRYILETVIEENLARAGYAILHPETLPLAAQVAAYRAAETAIFADGSAIHLAAPVLPSHARVAVLYRRSSPPDRLRTLLLACGLAPPVEHGGLLGWIESLPPGAPALRGPETRNFATLPDFAALGARLEREGLIPPGVWRTPAEAEIEAAIAAELQARRLAQPHLVHRFVRQDG